MDTYLWERRKALLGALLRQKESQQPAAFPPFPFVLGSQTGTLRCSPAGFVLPWLLFEACRKGLARLLRPAWFCDVGKCKLLARPGERQL